MNSRERVLTTLKHRQPDRVPVDLASHGSSGISAIAYARLRKFLGLKEKPIRVFDPVQQLALVGEDVLNRFGVDAIDLGRGFALDDAAWADWALPDGTPCQMPRWALPERGKDQWVIRSKNDTVIARMPDGVLYFEQCYFPFSEEGGPKTIAEAMDNCSWTAITSPPGPLIEGPDGLRLLAEGAQTLRENTERAIVWSFGGNLFEIGQFFYGMENFFALLASEPKRAHDFLDKLVEFHLVNLERLLGTVGKYIDIILFSDDLGMQTGLLLSPKMYREFFKPRHAIMWKRAKDLTNLKVMLHCDGAIRELIPDLIEIGLDAVNPVGISCRGMDAAELKAEFGKDLVFWGGGCDGQTVLFRGTPEEIKRHVMEQVKIFSSGGGFVFQQVDNIMANVASEKIVAMYEAVNSGA
jgi:uroporphyrinogen decarboxylase